MINFDVETTDVPVPGLRLENQPRIVEIAAIKVSDFDCEENDSQAGREQWEEEYVKPVEDGKRPLQVITNTRFYSLVNPVVKIPASSTKYHGIEDRHVAQAPTFPQLFKKLAKWFVGEHFLCAHNITFDVEMFQIELRRISAECRFPWPYYHICTAEKSERLNDGKKLTLEALYEHYTGEAVKDWHHAMADTEALTTIATFMRNDEKLS